MRALLSLVLAPCLFAQAQLLKLHTAEEYDQFIGALTDRAKLKRLQPVLI